MKTGPCLLILALQVLATLAADRVLPDYIPQCKRRDPEFVKCVLAAVDKVKPRLLEGIPEINVPPYDPLVIPKLTVDRNLQAITVKATLTNVKTHGPSGFKIKKLKIDLDKYSADLSLILPNIKVTCNYDVSGRLLLIPLQGKGFMSGNFTDLQARGKGSAKIIKKNGVEYLEIDKLILKTKIGGGQVKFVAKDDTRLIAETAAGFFNGNPRLVLDIINPIIEDSAKSVVLEMVNKIFTSIPLSELLPEE